MLGRKAEDAGSEQQVSTDYQQGNSQSQHAANEEKPSGETNDQLAPENEPDDLPF